MNHHLAPIGASLDDAAPAPGGSQRSRRRVYLSSTYQDLVGYRRKVDAALRQLGYDVVAMESYVAMDARPVDRCLADVQASDVYVGVFAWRYGFIPSGYDRSITELEYEEAGRAGRERLIFLARDDAPWPPNQIERDAGFSGSSACEGSSDGSTWLDSSPRPTTWPPRL
jgi:hypothetical protein